jgi:Na+/melibiose symporter-like transporter
MEDILMYGTTDSALQGTDEQAAAYQRARRRVGQIRGFYSNLFSYLVIVGFLAVVNLLTDRTYFWFLWVAAGWGVAVAFHAYATFVNSGPFGREWEERKIGEIMERERSERA